MFFLIFTAIMTGVLAEESPEVTPTPPIPTSTFGYFPRQARMTVVCPPGFKVEWAQDVNGCLTYHCLPKDTNTPTSTPTTTTPQPCYPWARMTMVCPPGFKVEYGFDDKGCPTVRCVPRFVYIPTTSATSASYQRRSHSDNIRGKLYPSD